MVGLAVNPEQKEYYQSSRSELADFDDTSTWLAEVLDGQMRSRFNYRFDGYDLVARGNQKLGDVFYKAIEDAELKVASDSRFLFELTRRCTELHEYHDMLEMSSGETDFNTIVVVSDFPEDVEKIGGDFGGYNIRRKQTMLRVISRESDGTITVTSQSLDQSNRYALEKIYKYLGTEAGEGQLLGQRIYLNKSSSAQEGLLDELTGVYDSSLSFVFGGEWYAGRAGSDRRNMLDFAYQQRDLIDVFLTGSQDEDARYNLSAMVEARFEGRARPSVVLMSVGPISASYVEQQMRHFGQLARSEGKVYSGCGASLSARAELDSLGYGDVGRMQESSGSDKYGSLTFPCKNGHQNRRPYGKLIDKCTTCKVSVKC